MQSQLSRTIACLACAVCSALAWPAAAAVPQIASVEGVLLSAGGGPAADGNYTVTFAIFPQSLGGAAVWTETTTLSAKGGQFNWALGSKSALSPAVLNLATPFLSVVVGADPELPRLPLATTLYAQRAAVAEALECSGCLKAAALDSAVLQPYAKTADLSGFAKAADLSAYAKASDLDAYAKVASPMFWRGTVNSATGCLPPSCVR